MDSKNQIISFNANDELEISVRMDEETVWLTQSQMSLLFDTSSDNISLHLKNIFKDGELLENTTTEDFSVVRQEGKRQVKRKLKHYNLDAIISVGYRVSSVRATQFRIWATKRLKDYLLKGYAINEKRLNENKQQFLKALDDLKILTHNKKQIKSDDILELVQSFADTWFTLDSFDKADFPQQGNEQNISIQAEELYQDLQAFKTELINKKEATQLFAQEKKQGSLTGIFGSVFQTVFGQDAYPTVEEKSAHLLYFIVKNHPFDDGNKRSGAFAFIWLLTKFKFDFYDKISPQTLSALTLLIAESNPLEKDKMVGLVKLLLK